SYIQEHLEVECRIGLQRAQDLFYTLAFYRDRKVASKLAHVQQLVRKSLFEFRRNWPLHVLVVFEETHNRARWALQTMYGGIQFRSFEFCLPGMPLVGKPRILLHLLL